MFFCHIVKYRNKKTTPPHDRKRWFDGLYFSYQIFSTGRVFDEKDFYRFYDRDGVGGGSGISP
jgi:hypothetical protein